MRHPMFNRTFVNRNPDMNNRNFVPGYEVGIWALGRRAIAAVGHRLPLRHGRDKPGHDG